LVLPALAPPALEPALEVALPAPAIGAEPAVPVLAPAVPGAPATLAAPAIGAAPAVPPPVVLSELQ